MEKEPKMELKHLLESGGLFYDLEMDDLEKKEYDEDAFRIIENEIVRMDYLNDPLLGLVSDFARRRNLVSFPNEFEEYESSLDVLLFLFRHIYKIRTPRAVLVYGQRFRRYNSPDNYVVLASLRNFGLDPIQFWYFFLFCIYYVDELTQVEILGRSIKEDLELFVDQINKMNFSNKNWKTSYPLNAGELTIKGDKKITITNQQTIHLISCLIEDYLNGEHDKQTMEKMTVIEPKPTPNYIKYLYYDTKEELTDEEYPKKIHGECFDGLLHRYETESGKNKKWHKIAILKYFVFSYLNENKGKSIVADFEEYKDCEKRIAKSGLITDKMKLFSLMLYVTGNLEPDSGSKITKDDIKKYYDSDDDGNWEQLKDYVWSNIKKYNINSEEGLNKYLKKLALRKREKSLRR